MVAPPAPAFAQAVAVPAVAVPAAFCGALLVGLVAANEQALRILYAGLMLGLASWFLSAPQAELVEQAAEECTVDDQLSSQLRSVEAADGRVLSYRAPPQGSLTSIGATGAGSFLTGLLGVGTGEVVFPQCVRSCCMPLALAAGTSVATVVCTAAAAAIVQFASLAAAVGGDILSVVPWPLVKFTIPGVLIGGQIAPLLASRQVLADRQIELFAAALFGTVGIAFLLKALT